MKDEVTRICDRAKVDLLAILSAQQPKLEVVAVLPEWLTASQLAEHWQLTNDEGKPTTAGIQKWAKRKPEDFPLPHAYMGDRIRFPRIEVDQWAREEAERRRTAKSKTCQPKRESATGSQSTSTIRPSLTAAVGGR